MTTTPPRPVVVGHDGTYASSGALRYALAEARRSDVPLRIVHAMPLQTSAFLDLPVLAEELDAERQQVEATVRSEVARLADDVEVQVVTCHGAPASVLLGAAEDARLLVIGREHRTGLRRLLGGATTEDVAAHAGAPLVVVPEGWRDDQVPRQRVVVALKAPAHSTELLGAAFRRAEQSGAALRVVHAWEPDDRVVGHRPDGWTPQVLLVERAVAAIDDLLGPWRRAFPGVVVHVEVHVADPRTDLLEESAAADLVVLLRGEAPVLGPHLGGVLRPVLHAADCPVLLVPATKAELPPLDLELEHAGTLLR
ncbi:universal stress protein [Nocardioides kongjuensis]|uniref:Nucleotide-binding universal stress UspA family protein n=1 Tax=Nocardioides kongjuensis TaxID=349522 RepID=A0A852RK14_9ACTN|nr:universal stress protein [Nocardioides kongjuensis]NYD29666.1 nucleotide-binding universal stress UspA family protein [Nocardioides kongjuensis]